VSLVIEAVPILQDRRSALHRHWLSVIAFMEAPIPAPVPADDFAHFLNESIMIPFLIFPPLGIAIIDRAEHPDRV
jgi:hypothetical protein